LHDLIANFKLQLGDNAKQLLSNGDIEMGHGRALLPLSNEQQFEVGNQVVQKSLSVIAWHYRPVAIGGLNY
jgi:hypothetical protein